MNNINHKYDIYKTYEIFEIFNSLKNNELPDKILYHHKDYDDSLKRTNIIKQLINRDGLFCKKCKKVPEYFALGKDNRNRWHLDLYSFDNDHYMFTIDHIFPKSRGGENILENYQLLCKPCNELKSDKIEDIIEENFSIETSEIKNNYIINKTNSLSQQIRGIITKIKKHSLINIKKIDGFTIGKEYKIIDILITVNSDLKIIYNILLKNDQNNIVSSDFENFMTKKDYYNLIY
jgi:5-methylcytosine-specific restriction endonuclease McrA